MENTINESSESSENSTFSFIRDKWERQLIENGYQTINELQLWDWLKTYELDSFEFICFQMMIRYYVLVKKCSHCQIDQIIHALLSVILCEYCNISQKKGLINFG